MNAFSQWTLVIGLALVVGGFWLPLVLFVRWRKRRRTPEPPARRPRSQRPAAGTVVFAAGRVQQPRVAIPAGSARGNPVASPYPGVGGGATAVFSRVPAGALSPTGGHRAGRTPGGHRPGRPVAARLESAKWGAPRRASGVPGRAVRGTRPGTPAEQTAVLRRVQDQQTETWERVGATTPTR